MQKKTVTIVGSYNVGFFLKGQRLPSLGETIIADEFKEGGGGKGSNQAVTAARLGADTRFIGRIGSDKYGDDALSMYKNLGIATDMIKIDKSIHSGISVILIDKNGRNLISVVPGANLNLAKEDIDSAERMIKDSFIVGFQLENKHETVYYGIRKAHAVKVRTFLDPAPAVKLPNDLYPCIEIIKPNETEASILTGIEVKDPSTAGAAGRWLVQRGVQTAIITLGENGVILVTKNKTKHFPAPVVDAIDSTGAGDIFSGGFLAALSKGRSIEESVLFAIHAAALSTTRLGVIESIPEGGEVTDFMRKLK